MFDPFLTLQRQLAYGVLFGSTSIGAVEKRVVVEASETARRLEFSLNSIPRYLKLGRQVVQWGRVTH